VRKIIGQRGGRGERERIEAVANINGNGKQLHERIERRCAEEGGTMFVFGRRTICGFIKKSNWL
jgi:hypothetical protein